ncbi:hypothetical protein Bpla01_42860 [Burkholderia plantarii]|nr:hypothetical protein Bpla01_42860 [Burkholderia plantarii]
MSPAAASIDSSRRMSAGFVLTLPAMISDDSGTPSCCDSKASTWTAKANRLLVFMLGDLAARLAGRLGEKVCS